MSLINQMLRDLEDRDRKRQSRLTSASRRRLQVTASPSHDSRFLIVAALLALFLTGGAITIWDAPQDQGLLEKLVLNAEPTEATVRPLLEPSRPFAKKKIPTKDKLVVAFAPDAPEQTLAPDPTGAAPSELKTSMTTPDPAALTPKKPPPFSEKKQSHKQCCQGSNCGKTPGNNATANCSLVSPVRQIKVKRKIAPKSAVSAIQKKPRTLNDKQKSIKLYQDGYIDARHGRVDTARSNLERALRLNPKNLQASLLLARVYMESERHQLAASVLDNGLNTQPGDAQLSMLRANLYLQQKNPELALRTLKRGLTNARGDAGYYAFLAGLYQRQQQHGHAVLLYHRALSITPDAAKWWLGLAISLEALNRLPESLKAFKRALRGNTLAQKALEYVQQRVAVLVAENAVVNE